MRLSVELPLPPKEASANKKGGHWGTRSAAVKKYRAACAWAFTSARTCLPTYPLPKVVLHLDFYYARHVWSHLYCYAKDVDNAIHSIKAAQDALQDADIIANDNAAHLTLGDVNLFTRKKQHQGRACVVFHLEFETPAEVKTNG